MFNVRPSKQPINRRESPCWKTTRTFSDIDKRADEAATKPSPSREAKYFFFPLPKTDYGAGVLLCLLWLSKLAMNLPTSLPKGKLPFLPQLAPGQTNTSVLVWGSGTSNNKKKKRRKTKRKGKNLLFFFKSGRDPEGGAGKVSLSLSEVYLGGPPIHLNRESQRPCPACVSLNTFTLPPLSPLPSP